MRWRVNDSLDETMRCRSARRRESMPSVTTCPNPACGCRLCLPDALPPGASLRFPRCKATLRTPVQPVPSSIPYAVPAVEPKSEPSEPRPILSTEQEKTCAVGEPRLWVLQQGRAEGPFPVSVVKARLASGQLQPQTL